MPETGGRDQYVFFVLSPTPAGTWVYAFSTLSHFPLTHILYSFHNLSIFPTCVLETHFFFDLIDLCVFCAAELAQTLGDPMNG